MLKVNDIEIRPTIFPDQTSQVWKIPPEFFDEQEVKVEWKFDYEGEFLHLAQLKTLLDSYGVKSSLYIPYLPYARQDKEISNKSTFALKTFVKLLNSLNFTKVEMLDPHSSVALESINNSVTRNHFVIINKVEKILVPTMICFPDSGASDRYSYNNFITRMFLSGTKVRNQLTGQIISYSITKDPKNQKVLIVDDLCDGGATFVLLTKELLSAGAKEVNLFVTHGIFSRGLKPLKEAGINRIYTHEGEVGEDANGLFYRRL